jgi:hypothetical protein
MEQKMKSWFTSLFSHFIPKNLKKFRFFTDIATHSSKIPEEELKNILPVSVLQRLQELEKDRDVMTEQEYLYQRQLIIVKYLENKEDKTTNHQLPNVEDIEKEMQSLLEAKSQGFISQTVFEQKYLDSAYKLMKYKSERNIH